MFGDRKLGTQMKATGEVMAIDRSFEAAFLKSIRSLEIGIKGLILPELVELNNDQLIERLKFADDERIFVLAEALNRGFTIDEIWDITKIDKYFLKKIKNIIDFTDRLAKKDLTGKILKEAKKIGFSDFEIGKIKGLNEDEIRK